MTSWVRAEVKIEASRKRKGFANGRGTPPGYQRPQSEDGASAAAAQSNLNFKPEGVRSPSRPQAVFRRDTPQAGSLLGEGPFCFSSEAWAFNGLTLVSVALNPITGGCDEKIVLPVPYCSFLHGTETQSLLPAQDHHDRRLYLAGDGYDIWARLLSAHLPRHIPGEPNIVVQNMPGAGSLIAANSIYNTAKPDGLTLGAIGPSVYLDQLMGKKEAQFDWAKFTWIGSTEKTAWLFYMRTDTPYKTLEDIRKAPSRRSVRDRHGPSGHFVPSSSKKRSAPSSGRHGIQGRIGARSGAGERRGAVPRARIPNFTRASVRHWRKKQPGARFLKRPRARSRAADVPTIFE